MERIGWAELRNFADGTLRRCEIGGDFHLQTTTGYPPPSCIRFIPPGQFFVFFAEQIVLAVFDSIRRGWQAERDIEMGRFAEVRRILSSVASSLTHNGSIRGQRFVLSSTYCRTYIGARTLRPGMRITHIFCSALVCSRFPSSPWTSSTRSVPHTFTHTTSITSPESVRPRLWACASLARQQN